MKVSTVRKQTFVEALVRGAAPEAAARAIGVDRRTAYRWRAADPAFAEQWEDARDRQIEAVETVLYRMAMEKDLGAVIFFLKCHKPEVYNRRQVFALGGDPDNPFAVHHHGAVESNVHFYMPSNRRDQAEDDGDDTPPVTIDGTTIDGEDDAA